MDRMKILAVDDNTVNLATLEQELKDKYEVIPMISGRRAIKYLYREKVDLILLDVQMPIMDGIETLKEIRTQENGVTVPVIFLTAKKDRNTVVEGAKLGIMDYIVKPFTSDDLHERIELVFKRLGVLPMENDELYDRLKHILEDTEEGRQKAAINKTEEVLGYQIGEEISGRMHNVRSKLEAGDMEAAGSMVSRIMRLMEKNMAVTSKSNAVPISMGELNARLLYILDDLENFKVKDAGQKIKELFKFDVPPYVLDAAQKAQEKLNEYDDDDAEKLIRAALEEMKKPSALKKQDGGPGGNKGAGSTQGTGDERKNRYHTNSFLR